MTAENIISLSSVSLGSEAASDKKKRSHQEPATHLLPRADGVGGEGATETQGQAGDGAALGVQPSLCLPAVCSWRSNCW